MIFLRYPGRDPEAAARLIEDTLSAGTLLESRFTVIEEDGIRQRIY